MKKVYVIGIGNGGTLSEVVKRAKEILQLKEEVEIILVEDIEDVPLKERLSSDPSVIQQINQFSNPRVGEPYVSYF